MNIRDLPIGTKVREKKSLLRFIIADHHHIAYSGTSLITDNAVKLASFDAAEDENPEKEKQESGNNFYPFSNIHQWLNSSNSNWYKPAHPFDSPPVIERIDLGRNDFYNIPFYSNEAKFIGDFSNKKDPGFLMQFSQEFCDALLTVDVPCYIDPVPGEIHFGPPDPYLLPAKVFLLSAPEMGFEKIKMGSEGYKFRLFNDPRMRVVAPTPSAIWKRSDYIYDDCSFFYWLRTPIANSSSMAMIYNSDHKVGDNNGLSVGQLPVNAICGIRPAMNIDPQVNVSNVPDENGIYTINFGEAR